VHRAAFFVLVLMEGDQGAQERYGSEGAVVCYYPGDEWFAEHDALCSDDLPNSRRHSDQDA